MIEQFKGKNFCYSNFSSHGFTDEKGRFWKTNEHFFQAMKVDPLHPKYSKWMEKIRNAETAKKAKRLGKQCPLRSDWEKLKVFFMYKGLKFKFDQNEKIKEKLIKTDIEILSHENNHGDIFWGKVNGYGKNLLGRLLMTIREEYIWILKNDA